MVEGLGPTEPYYRFGTRYARPPMVGFSEDSNELAFEFPDPPLVKPEDWSASRSRTVGRQARSE